MTQAAIPLVGSAQVANLEQSLYTLTTAFNASGIGSASIEPPPGVDRCAPLNDVLNTFARSVNAVTAPDTVSLLGIVGPDEILSAINGMIVEINAFDSGGGGGSLPLDVVAGALAAYSQRRLATAFAADVIEIDNGVSTQSFAADTDGAVDAAAITSFIGGGAGTVATSFDQSGNGYDRVTTDIPANSVPWTASAFPAGVPALDDTGNWSPLQTDANVSFPGGAATFAMAVIVTEEDTGRICRLFGSDGDGGINITVGCGNNNAGEFYVNISKASGGNSVYWASTEIMSAGAHVLMANIADDGTVTASMDGTALTMTADGANVISPAFTDGVFQAPGSNSDTIEGEMIVWPSAVSIIGQSLLRQNIASYYGITLA